MEAALMDTFARMPYGIYVLTCCLGQEMNGMIASWVSQVSHDPPLVMAAVHPNRYSHHLIEKGKAFAIHIISREQKDLLTRFKGTDPLAKFNALSWSKGRTGCPILRDCIGYLECTLEAVYAPGNHTLFIGRVLDGNAFLKDVPLTTLDYSGTYTGKD